LKELFVEKGYEFKTDCNDVKNFGDFCFEYKNKAKKTLGNVTLLPKRNVYPYSFIGIISGAEGRKAEKDYLVLAVTSGVSGIRSGAAGAGIIFNTVPLKAGFSLEDAVAAIESQLSAKFGPGFSLGDDDNNKLLLLDQGGDVHQWLGAGGVKTVVGSSEGRKLISSELIVATDE
jgi:hypothetical protein